jgi:hypothetical protein
MQNSCQSCFVFRNIQRLNFETLTQLVKQIYSCIISVLVILA